MAKKIKKSYLDCSDEHCFYVNDGRVIKNLSQLPAALKNIHRDTFNHHVNDKKNDFANWVEEVYRERKLGTRLRQIKNPAGMLQAIRQHL